MISGFKFRSLKLKRVWVKNGGLALDATLLLDMTVVLWLCNAFLRKVVAKALLVIHLHQYLSLLTTAIIYLPFLLYIAISKKIPFKYFQCFFLACAVFFGFTLLLHPSYLHWYTRESFGAVDVVFRPERGAIWAFLMVEICGDAKRLWKNFQWASVGLFVYNMLLWLEAKRAGYWEYVGSDGRVTERSYSLEFGYSMAFVLFIVFLTYMVEKKRWQLLFSILLVILILDSGSRGSLLALVLFGFIFFIDAKWSRQDKLRNFLLLGGIGGLALLSVNQIVLLLVKLLKRYNISSRTLTMLVSGDAIDDNGRDKIQALALKEIKENSLFGYGAFGDRQFIGPYYNWGYSHSIVYEMWVDFGVVLGTLFLTAAILITAKIILSEKDPFIRGCVVVVVCVAVRLAVSNTFWGDPYYWMLIALLTKWMFVYRKRSRYMSAAKLYQKLNT
ncbi:MAG: O-antigen ligase family protein [Ruminococcus sp.]|nr:O-antigen ligase family protein [Ruminococcus sp.]